MYRIAVCDDDGNDCREAEKHVLDFFRKKEEAVSVFPFSSMDALLASDLPYDLYLLDVLMPEKSGIEGARELQSRLTGPGGNDPLIVFITSSLDSAVEGYQVNAAGFILKPIGTEKFHDTMERIYTRHLAARPEFLSVVSSRMPLRVPVAQIMSVESQLHQTYLHLTGGRSVSLGMKLSEVMGLLAPYPQFLRCHQSYVVNLRFVTAIDSSGFRLEDQRQIPVSRAYYKNCKYIWYQYYLQPQGKEPGAGE